MRWKVGYHDLSNGIRVYYFYDSGDTTHICGVGFRVGSAHDPPNARGEAHLVEHLLFRGVPRNSDDLTHNPVYDMIFRYFGGMEEHNILTNFGVTYYGGPGLYRRQHIHEVMSVIVNVLKARFVNRLGVDIEKTVVNNEYRQTDLDEAVSRMDTLFYKTMYDTNPVRNGVLGDIEQLRVLKLNDLNQFIEHHYVAENMFVPIFGPTSKESIAIARKYLDDWPFKGSPTKLDVKSFDRVPVLTSPRVVEKPQIGQVQHYVATGFVTCAYGNTEDAALDVIAKVVERRLYDVIREKSHNFTEGNYHNPVFSERSLAHGAVGAWFATASLDFSRYGRDAIVSEFTRLREELIPWEKFERARDSLREKFFGKFRDSPEMVADLVIQAAANGDRDLTLLHTYPKRLNSLKPAKVREVANRYFSKNSFVSVTVTPV